MISLKKLKARVTEYIDNPSNHYLYLVPVIGGIKCYRITKQIKLLEHATDRSQTDYFSKLYEIAPGYKAGVSEFGKLSTLLVFLHGLTVNNRFELALGTIGYLLSSYVQKP